MSTRNEILKYTLLPGFIPRILAFFRSGFVHVAYMMAVIYGNVRLLPQNHPYLQPENIGRFGIRHVIAEASNQLVFTRNNLDQIIIYFTILAGLILLFLQFALLIVSIMATQPAFALAVTDLFNNPPGGGVTNAATGARGPEQDIAFIILDRIFGVPGIFNSCISNLGVPCEDMLGNPLANQVTAYPFPFHLALHRLLQFYSYGIFLVGIFVIIYFVITITSETAQTGTPFGQRFNKAWAPVRFILFFALITPLTGVGVRANAEGYNLAQLITFGIVKMGSNLATNGWSYFNTNGTDGGLSGSYMSQQLDLVATPNIPEINDLIQTIFLARTCAAAYHQQYGSQTDILGKRIEAYVVRPQPPAALPAPATTGNATFPANPALPVPADRQARLLSGTNATQAIDFSYQGSITVRFGNLGGGDLDLSTAGFQADESYNAYTGQVKPLCGEVKFTLDNSGEPGTAVLNTTYYDMVRNLWTDAFIIERARCIAKQHITIGQDLTCTPWPDKAWAMGLIDSYKAIIRADVTTAINNQRAAGNFNVPPELIERGWAGAAIWYNRIAAMNGALTTAVFNIPKASKIPFLMDVALKSNLAQNDSVDAKNMYDPKTADTLGVNVLLEMDKKQKEILDAMTTADQFWVNEGNAQSSNFSKASGNILIDFINAVFGTSGIFEMRDNQNVHPLAQLTTLGKGMMDAALRNTAYGMALGGAGSLGFKLNVFGPKTKEAMETFSGFFITMALTTMGIAAVLYYVLPFLPFVYFMFAVSGWIKSIFEAIVAMPLWALAHLRIDGEGLPGPGASNGYFLLLEIFLRPILIIFGFIASISIFAALVSVLNDIFDLLLGNIGGFNNEMEMNIRSGKTAGVASTLSVARGAVDEFFFTAMYTIIVYLMGMASFKLVDLIPNQILRWAGVSVSTFQENAGDPAGQLTSNIYRGSILTTNMVQRRGGDLAAILS